MMSAAMPLSGSIWSPCSAQWVRCRVWSLVASWWDALDVLTCSAGACSRPWFSRSSCPCQWRARRRCWRFCASFRACSFPPGRPFTFSLSNHFRLIAEPLHLAFSLRWVAAVRCLARCIWWWCRCGRRPCSPVGRCWWRGRWGQKLATRATGRCYEDQIYSNVFLFNLTWCSFTLSVGLLLVQYIVDPLKMSSGTLSQASMLTFLTASWNMNNKLFKFGLINDKLS